MAKSDFENLKVYLRSIGRVSNKSITPWLRDYRPRTTDLELRTTDHGLLTDFGRSVTEFAIETEMNHNHPQPKAVTVLTSSGCLSNSVMLIY